MIAGSGGAPVPKKTFARSLKKLSSTCCRIWPPPNIHEAQEISGVKIESTEDSIEAALKNRRKPVML